MDQGHLKDVEDICRAYRLIDTLHDFQLISGDDRSRFLLILNDKAHSAISLLLDIV